MTLNEGTIMKPAIQSKFFISVCTALMLCACGGGSSGETGEPVTFVQEMKSYEEEAASYVAMRRQVQARGAVPLELKCGSYSFDPAKATDLPDPPLLDGNTPGLIYFTFGAADAERVRDLRWSYVVDDWWRRNIRDPQDCGALPDTD